jgi:hypothetical protein
MQQNITFKCWQLCHPLVARPEELRKLFVARVVTIHGFRHLFYHVTSDN